MKNKNNKSNSDNKFYSKKSSYLDEFEAEFDDDSLEELTEAEKRMLSRSSVSDDEISETSEWQSDYDEESDGGFEEELDEYLVEDIEEVLNQNSEADKEVISKDNVDVALASAATGLGGIMAANQPMRATKTKFDFAAIENSEPVEPFVAKSSFFHDESSSDFVEISSENNSSDMGEAAEDAELSENSSVENADTGEENISEVNGTEIESTVQDGELEDAPSDTEKDNQLTPEEAAARKKRKITYDLLMIASLAVFLYCVGRIGIYFYEHVKYKQDMKELQGMVGSIIQEPPVANNEVAANIFFPDEKIYASTSVNYSNEVSEEWSHKYSGLVELNPDCVGWIQIEDTEINYPVMYTPNDYDYYLRKDFEGNYLTRGVPFMALGTQLNVSQNYLIYGHNMRDGTAFHDLVKYLDKEWVDQHPYAYFNTAYSQGIYQVMDVVISKVYNVNDNCFKYYKYSGNLSEDDFNTYVYYMDKMSKFDTGIDAVYGDQLLSLSTCYKVYDPDGRLVVVFKRIQ